MRGIPLSYEKLRVFKTGLFFTPHFFTIYCSMRTIFRTPLLLSALFTVAVAHAQTAPTGVGLGTASPDPSAALDVSSSKLGVLFPRVALTGPTDASTIATPAVGLVVYNTATTVNGLPQLVLNTGTTAAPAWAPLGANNYWTLKGNQGTSAANNFLGTTDSTAFTVRVNNRQVAQFQPGGALWIGDRNDNANQFIGYKAGVKVGPTDFIYGQIPGGTQDQFIGYLAGSSTTSGSGNQFIGSNAGKANDVGSGNQFIGPNAGMNATSTNGNQFIGVFSGYTTTFGSQNQYLGNYAGFKTTSGNNNQYIGYYAGYANTTGSSNQAIGYQAGQNITTGSTNQYIGYQAGQNTTTGSYNQAIGYATGNALTTGTYNLLVGPFAGNSITSGSRNLFIGSNTGTSTVTGTDNIFIGPGSGNSNTGSSNIYIGSNAGGQSTSGTQNTVMGSASGSTSGNNNAYFGSGTGGSSGDNNACFGSGSGSIVSQGSNNTAMGYQAGANMAGASNTMIGALADVIDQRFNKAVAIGYNAKAGGNNVMALGGTGVDAVKIGIGTTMPGEVLTVQGNILASGTITQNSDRRLKTNIRPLTGALAGIGRLRGVRYVFLPGKGPEGEQLGVIAQEVEKVYPELVRTDKVNGIKSVNYAQLTPVLLEAIKELTQQVDAQTALLDAQAGHQQQLERQQAGTMASLEELRTVLQRLEEGKLTPASLVRAH